jgi:hypothetical protein
MIAFIEKTIYPIKYIDNNPVTIILIIVEGVTNVDKSINFIDTAI